MPNVSFLEAQTTYESLGSFDIDTHLENLDAAISQYDTARTEANERIAEAAFAPIAEYYSKLVGINETLQEFINVSAKSMAESSPRLPSEERYNNRVYPEESVETREATNGVFPELRQRSLPYLISVSVFMAFLSIFLIFQMNGFSGQLNIPPITLITDNSPGDSMPFYKSPMVLAGVGLITLTSAVILYYRAKNTNR